MGKFVKIMFLFLLSAFHFGHAAETDNDRAISDQSQLKVLLCNVSNARAGSGSIKFTVDLIPIQNSHNINDNFYTVSIKEVNLKIKKSNEMDIGVLDKIHASIDIRVPSDGIPLIADVDRGANWDFHALNFGDGALFHNIYLGILHSDYSKAILYTHWSGSNLQFENRRTTQRVELSCVPSGQG